MNARFALEDVPQITGLEHADILTDAVAVALCYGNDELPKRFPGGVYDAMSGFSGRGWLIGFDDASYYWQERGVDPPRADFAVRDAYLKYPETMCDAIRLLGRVPEFLLNAECEHPLDPVQAAGLIGMSKKVDAPAIRGYVTDTLTARRRPVVALLHLPAVPVVEFALLTGYESGGDVILGRSPYQEQGMDNSGECGTFRLPDWERQVVAVVGLGEGEKTKWSKAPGFLAIENGLKCGRSYTEGTRHYGLSTYDAWERALLDDESFLGLDDDLLRRRLQCHSGTAGVIACQKCFTALPWCNAPSMGVVDGFAKRAAAAPLLIHGLMWDVWHAVGAYWKTGDDELQRFRDPAVRRRAAEVVRRAGDVDAQALQDLQTAKEEWESCLGHGKSHPCPCWNRPCARL